MRHIVAVAIVGLCVGCGNKVTPPSPITPTKIEGAEPLAHALDFIDNTHKYKGKILVVPLKVGSIPVGGAGGTLRDCHGASVPFFGFVKQNKGRLDITINIPESLDVPNAKFLDPVLVTFRCNDGQLTAGNEALEITRR